MTKYPLIEKLGLNIKYLSNEKFELTSPHVRADELEAFLEKAPVVYGEMGRRAFVHTQDEHDTHTALLVGVELIQKGTAESLLRELVDAGPVKKEILWEIQDRARRLLEGK